jgi:hypothetical protein
MYVYHFHAQYQQDENNMLHFDGILERSEPVRSRYTFSDAKAAIAQKMSGNPPADKVIVTSLTLLHKW